MEKNLYHLAPDDRKRLGIEQLPETLGEAIELTAESELVLRTLGEHMFNRYVEIKRQEWEDYRVQVTQWELDRYLPGALTRRAFKARGRPDDVRGDARNPASSPALLLALAAHRLRHDHRRSRSRPRRCAQAMRARGAPARPGRGRACSAPVPASSSIPAAATRARRSWAATWPAPRPSRPVIAAYARLRLAATIPDVGTTARCKWAGFRMDCLVQRDAATPRTRSSGGALSLRRDFVVTQAVAPG